MDEGLIGWLIGWSWSLFWYNDLVEKSCSWTPMSEWFAFTTNWRKGRTLEGSLFNVWIGIRYKWSIRCWESQLIATGFRRTIWTRWKRNSCFWCFLKCNIWIRGSDGQYCVTFSTSYELLDNLYRMKSEKDCELIWRRAQLWFGLKAFFWIENGRQLNNKTICKSNGKCIASSFRDRCLKSLILLFWKHFLFFFTNWKWKAHAF